MSYEVKQGNIFGRLGSGIGKGLAEQVPKEIERHRLSSGLKELSSKKNLSPFEQFAELSSIPGATPQMIESGSKLLATQAKRNSYDNKLNAKEESVNQNPHRSISQEIRDVNFAKKQNGQPVIERKTSVQNENVLPNESGQPQINQNNPLRSEAQPILPWTQNQRDQDIARVWNDNPNLTFQEAASISSDNEKRDIERPQAVRAQDAALQDIQDKAKEKFNKSLQLKLQKDSSGVFKDITGEMQNNLQRGLERDLRTNSNSTIDDIVNDWTNRALDLAKTKTDLDEYASTRGFYDNIAKSQETFDKLKSYQKIFEKAGNNEEFYNILKRAQTKNETGFNMSPQGAALIAYPRSSKVSELIKNSERSSSIPEKRQAQSRKHAMEIEKTITSGDSLLAIAKEFKMKDPYFDERSFFGQLRDDQDELALSPRQLRELGRGESDLFPDWGDVWILPTFKGQLK